MNKRIAMIEEHQCPGCVSGSDTECGSFKLLENGGFRCDNHTPGTSILGATFKLLLGMPKGFNRAQAGIKDTIWFFDKLEDSWGKDAEDNFDFAVWKKKESGRTFLRVVQPRIGRVQIHVIDSTVGYNDIKCTEVTELDMD